MLSGCEEVEPALDSSALLSSRRESVIEDLARCFFKVLLKERMKQHVWGVAVGLVVAWSIMVIQGVTHPGYQEKRKFNLAPDPLICTSSTCWDRVSTGHGKGRPDCTPGVGQVVNGKVIEIGKQTCYKSAAINRDRYTVAAFFYLLTMIGTFARMVEHFTVLFIMKRLRYSAFLGIVFNFFPLFYSWSVMFIYSNEHIESLYWSQLFYGVTELFVTLSLVMSSDSDSNVQTFALNASAGFCMFHLIQLIADEFSSIFDKKRNTVLLVCDTGTLLVCLYLVSSRNFQHWKVRAGFAGLGFMVFQFFFADEASFSWFQVLRA